MRLYLETECKLKQRETKSGPFVRRNSSTEIIHKGFKPEASVRWQLDLTRCPRHLRHDYIATPKDCDKIKKEKNTLK